MTGLFWWMPEDNEFWADKDPALKAWWNASLYTQNTGKPLAAMFEMRCFLNSTPSAVEKRHDRGGQEPNFQHLV